MLVTVHPKGTTLLDPERCFDGYAVVLPHGRHGLEGGLIDMNGAVVPQQDKDASP